jgi:hypothetical protein
MDFGFPQTQQRQPLLCVAHQVGGVEGAGMLPPGMNAERFGANAPDPTGEVVKN